MSEQTKIMAFCNACGTEVPEGARFCQNCGVELAPAAGVATMHTDPAMMQSRHPPALAPTYGVALPVYPPPPYPVVPGYIVAPTRSGKAVAGFWLGIVSIPCCILSWIGIIVGVLGVIFSLLGLGEARRIASATGGNPAQYGRRQAIIGISCAIFGILASAAFLIYLLNNLDKYGIKITG